MSFFSSVLLLFENTADCMHDLSILNLLMMRAIMNQLLMKASLSVLRSSYDVTVLYLMVQH